MNALTVFVAPQGFSLDRVTATSLNVMFGIVMVPMLSKGQTGWKLGKRSHIYINCACKQNIQYLISTLTYVLRIVKFGEFHVEDLS